jgi:hypothetical protein
VLVEAYPADEIFSASARLLTLILYVPAEAVDRVETVRRLEAAVVVFVVVEDLKRLKASAVAREPDAVLRERSIVFTFCHSLKRPSYSCFWSVRRSTRRYSMVISSSITLLQSKPLARPLIRLVLDIPYILLMRAGIPCLSYR